MIFFRTLNYIVSLVLFPQLLTKGLCHLKKPQCSCPICGPGLPYSHFSYPIGETLRGLKLEHRWKV
jgi:hypothetical protein